MRIILTKSNKKSNRNEAIGFFDSGVGGVTVFKQVKKLLHNENYIYFGDTKNMPYGEKTEAQLLEFADKIFRFLEEKKVKAVVMACNTTSAVVYEKLKNNYNFEIYPIIQSVAKVISQLPIQKLGVFATPATINSHAYAKEISKHNPKMQVFEIACPEWVKLVEEQKLHLETSKVAVAQKLHEMMDFTPEKIVLGCTHYPYLGDILTELLPSDIFLNPSIAFAEVIKKDLQEKDLLNNSTNEKFEQFFTSASPENFQHAAAMFYEIKELPTLVEFSAFRSKF